MRGPGKRIHYILGALILLVLFMVITAYGAYQSSMEIRRFVVDRELPAIGLAVGAKLEYSAYRYRSIGEELLEDHFLRNWILEGEEDPQRAIRFLQKVRDRYGLLDTSVVSDLSETYYSSEGTILKLSPENEERDGWYYLYRSRVEGSNIDSWRDPESGLLWIFVNIPIYDREGVYVGVTGAGIDSRDFDRILGSFESERNVSFTMARSDGRIVYRTDGTEGFYLSRAVMDQLSRNREHPAGTSIDRSGPEAFGAGDGFDADAPLWGTWLGEWNTYLVVEKASEAVGLLQRGAALRVFAYLGILALLLFLLTLFAISHLYRFLGGRFRDLERRAGEERAWTFMLERMAAQGWRTTETERLSGIASFLRGEEDSDTLKMAKPGEFLEKGLCELKERDRQLARILHWDISDGGMLFAESALSLLLILLQQMLAELARISPQGGDILVNGATEGNSFRLHVASQVREAFLPRQLIGHSSLLAGKIGASLGIADSSKDGTVLELIIPRQSSGNPNSSPF